MTALASDEKCLMDSFLKDVYFLFEFDNHSPSITEVIAST